MTNNPNSITAMESSTNSSKSNRFVESTKRAVRKVLTTAWITVGSMWPVATPTVVPASVNTITAIAPIASTTIKTIWLWTAAWLFTACGGGDDGFDGPVTPVDPIDTKDTVAPTINISKSSVDISWWKQVRIDWNQLYIGDELVASWTDNKTKNCNVTLTLNWNTITSWTTINEAWTLTIKVSDAAGNNKSSDIKLNVTEDQECISWLENLQNLNMQVDQEVNLLNWISFINWAELVKTEIGIDWKKIEISDPNHYIPTNPWTCSIIFTVKDKKWTIKEYKVDNLTIKGIEYKTMEINNISPKDILPIVWQVEEWDKKVYNRIEHLRLAESTRIRDMMRKYGAGNHSPEEYQQLMNRLNTGMINETPKWYNNYEVIWWDWATTPSNHSHNERDILNTLVEHANFKVVNPNSWRREYIREAVNQHPNSIYVLWMSAYAYGDKDLYNSRSISELKELYKSNNLLIFVAWSNIWTKNGVLKNKIYQESVDWDEHWVYGIPSSANWRSDSNVDKHLLVTIWTDADGDIDQTNEKSESSKYPVWFHNKVLFSGRAFPYRSWSNNKITGEPWKYATSYTNYTNVAIIDLCFQMFAEVENVDRLLEMARSTALTDYIRFNWETQELQLINPAWFFKKYLMPNDLPSNLKSWENVSLNKGYYKWVIFDIPWAEVKINWQWVTYSEANKSQIKNQNPMNLEWRLNGDLCRKMWYKWKDIQWKIIVVDDKWNGLNIEKDISINVR